MEGGDSCLQMRVCPPPPHGWCGSSVHRMGAVHVGGLGHVGPCSALCADWCHDFLFCPFFFTPLLDPRAPIHLGLCPRGGGGGLGVLWYANSIVS